MPTSGSSTGSPSGSPSGSPGRKARSLALLLLLLCGAAGLALWATRPSSDVPTSALSSTPGPVIPPSARPGDVPLAGGAARDAPRATAEPVPADEPSSPVVEHPRPSGDPKPAPEPTTPVRVVVREDGRLVEGATVMCKRVGKVDDAGKVVRTVEVRSGWSVASEYARMPGVRVPGRDPFRGTSIDASGPTEGGGAASFAVRAGWYEILARLEGIDTVGFGYVEGSVAGPGPVTFDVVLEEAVRVQGAVVDRDGQPVPYLRVQVWPAADARAKRASEPAITDEAGRFSLLGFGREPHVVAVVSASATEPDIELHDEPLEVEAEVAATTVVVPAGALRDVLVVVDRVAPMVLELRGVNGRSYWESDLEVAPAEAGVWLGAGGWGVESTGTRRADVLYRVVYGAVGCPWYVAQSADRAAFIVARRPGGRQAVTLAPGRLVSGRLGPAGTAAQVRAFLRAPNGDRVEFDVRSTKLVVEDEGAAEWSFRVAPTDAFDVAAYDGDVRRGPWVSIPAGASPVEGTLVPIDAPAATPAAGPR